MSSRRFLVILVNKEGRKEVQWSKECGTLTEANQAIFDAKKKATGYAILDREFQKFIKSKNFAFDNHEVDDFDAFKSF